jgi:hypothetical protein
MINHIINHIIIQYINLIDGFSQQKKHLITGRTGHPHRMMGVQEIHIFISPLLERKTRRATQR